jgi:hypothetical protein
MLMNLVVRDVVCRAGARRAQPVMAPAYPDNTLECGATPLNGASVPISAAAPGIVLAVANPNNIVGRGAKPPSTAPKQACATTLGTQLVATAEGQATRPTAGKRASRKYFLSFI